jgi:spoIIIJ-associated protein
VERERKSRGGTLKEFEAPTLEEACKLAQREYNCSLEDIEYKIIQYPRRILFGIMKKNAIIKVIDIRERRDKEAQEESAKEPLEDNSQAIINDFFSNSSSFLGDMEGATPTPKDSLNEYKEIESNQDTQKKDRVKSGDKVKESEETNSLEERAEEIKSIVKRLIDKSCFNIDTVEVTIEGKTAYIFLDGEDSALLIGKEGYRYNALSYILFNWVNLKYDLFLKLEIAEFLESQKRTIIKKLEPLVDKIQESGKGRSEPLDGILIQVALEYLRDKFPDKYVAIKRLDKDKRYIVVNNFNSRRYE